MKIKALAVAAVVVFGAPAAAHAEGKLTALPCVGDAPCLPAANLNQVAQIALSPDSHQLYAVSTVDSALTVFDRGATGALTQRAQCFRYDGLQGCDTGLGMQGARAVAVSPDGKSVYVGSSSGNLAVLDRAADGSLHQKPLPDACFGVGGCQATSNMGAPRSIAISPDGTTLYVASPSSITVFDRDTDGSLHQKPGNNGCITQGVVAGCAQVPQISNLRDIVVSPDGHNVYAGSPGFGAILTFDRAPTGTLSANGGMISAPAPGFVAGDRIAGSYGLAVSPDGRNVYSASWSVLDSGIAVLDRDPATGALSQAAAPSIDGCVANGDPRCRLGVAVDQVRDVAVSADGRSVYAATIEGVAVFDRAAGGDLTQKPLPDGCLQDRAQGGTNGCTAVDGTTESRWIAISPDGSSVYSSSTQMNTIAAFARELPPAPPATQTPPASGGSTVVSGGTSTTKLIAKLRSRSVKARRGKAFNVAYVSTIRGTATLEILKGRKPVLTIKSSSGKAFRIAKKLARGTYAIKLTLKAAGQTAGDSAKLSVR